jgi:hypothetical protein
MCRLVRRIVYDELETRGVPQTQAPPHFPTQKSSSPGESNSNFLRRMFRGEWGEEHAGEAHVGRETHGRYGYASHARVLYLARNELGEHTLNLRLYTP